MSILASRMILRRLSLVSIVLAMVCLPALASGQSSVDVVHLKDGSIIRGTIIERVPGKSVKIRTRDGNVFVYEMDEVEKIATESYQADELRTFKGVKLGLATPGEVSVDGVGSDDADISYSFGGFYDYPLSPKLTGGVAVDVDGLSYEDESGTMFNLALTLKAVIDRPDSKILWRPGLYIGYGRGSSGALDDGADFFVVGGLVELLILSEESINWLVELAIIGGPSGGNEDYEITYGPGFRLRGGISFK